MSEFEIRELPEVTLAPEQDKVIRFSCNACKHPMKAYKDEIGLRDYCSKCDTPFVIPARSTREKSSGGKAAKKPQPASNRNAYWLSRAVCVLLRAFAKK